MAVTPSPLLKAVDLPPSVTPFLTERVELPHLIAEESRKAIRHWEGDAWDAAKVQQALARFLEKIGEGVSPREAFRQTTYELHVQGRSWVPKPRNRLQDRLRLSDGTHQLIVRLAAEYGESYTEFTRGIVETWAAQHRWHCEEQPEWDLGYDPQWEGWTDAE